jgi:hypothetical protein
VPDILVRTLEAEGCLRAHLFSHGCESTPRTGWHAGGWS